LEFESKKKHKSRNKEMIYPWDEESMDQCWKENTKHECKSREEMDSGSKRVDA